MSNIKVQNIYYGKTKHYKTKEKEFDSAYIKNNSLETAFLSTLGLEEDFQEDKRYHGGVDKALLICSTNHFKTYKEQFNKEVDPFIFSANIFVNDIDESNVFVGDIYTLGEAVVQVTQPRQPCWKIGAIFDKEINRFIKQTYSNGWYIKVLQEGNISVGDTLVLTNRNSNITIKDMTKYLESKDIPEEKYQFLQSSDFVAQSYKNDIKK